MKVKELIEKLEELNPEIELELFTRDPKRPTLGTGFVHKIQDVEFERIVDQDTNKAYYAMEIMVKKEE